MRSMCKGSRCTGKMFGNWMECEHGIKSRLVELDKEMCKLTYLLEKVTPKQGQIRWDDALYQWERYDKGKWITV